MIRYTVLYPWFASSAVQQDIMVAERQYKMIVQTSGYNLLAPMFSHLSVDEFSYRSSPHQTGYEERSNRSINCSRAKVESSRQKNKDGVKNKTDESPVLF